ncbi:hypothetical protein F9K33_06725 [bacterium]|nr:MAG: hypothetical protein F9K33_06725 [bacterium]
MKTITVIKGGAALIAFIFFTFFLSSCYTVLKQSGEYYSEFDQEPSDKSKETNADIIQSDSLDAEDDSASDQDEYAETVVINRYYYDSPWWAGYRYGYPGSYWSVSLGYTWYPAGYYYPYDYYYWGGCYYPSYPGYYPYYSDPWYSPGTSYTAYSSRRNYGLRHDALNTTGSGQNRINAINSTAVISQRQYRSGTTAKSDMTAVSKNKKEAKATKKNRRRFNTNSATTASKPVEKKTGNSGQRNYREVDVPKNNNKTFQQGFESVKTHFSRNEYQSSRTFNSNESSDRRSASRSSGERSSSPNVNSRTYKK